MRAWIAVALGLVGPLAEPAPSSPDASKQGAIRFTLDPERRVYDVGVNFNYQTTIWTPVDCYEPAIGDRGVHVRRLWHDVHALGRPRDR